MNEKKHILLTGATGYIGQILSQELSSSFIVHTLVRNLPASSTSQLIHHRLDGPESIHQVFKQHPIETVVHLAAKAQYDWSEKTIPEFIHANIELGSLLLEIMSQYGCRQFINTATYWQEHSPFEHRAICFYAATKSAFEQILDFYCFEKNISAVSLRLHDVYGPKDPRPKLFTLLKASAESGQPFKTTKGEQTLFFTHIDDVVRAYKKALAEIPSIPSGAHSKFDVRGFPHTLKEAVKTYCQIHALKIQVEWGAQPYRKNQIMEPVLLDLLPGWQANTDIAIGFKDL